MHLADDPALRAFRERLRSWLAGQVPPAPEAGRPAVPDAEQLRAWSKALYAAGYVGLTWPTEYGGHGLPTSYQAVYAEECALADAPDQVNVIGLGMVGPTLIQHGSPRQKAAHLRAILRGDTICCQGFSEPEAGSDLAAVRTRGRRDGDGPGSAWILDGVKVWSSYAQLADLCLLLARTDPEAARHRGLTCFLLDMRAPGVQVRPLRQLNGDADFSEITLADVRVPAGCVLGTPGDGWRIALTTLAHERGTFGITLTARLARQLQRLIRTARELGAADDPAVRRELAALHVTMQGLRYTGYRALAEAEQAGQPSPASSILKLRWSEASQQATALALRLLGTDGALAGEAAFWGGYWQHQRLRSRANSIEGGTSEILRSIVADRVLGLPRAR